MKIKFLMLVLLTTNIVSNAQEENHQTITKNLMTVSWSFSNDRIHFEMSAPTDGWVTIGFNNHSGTTGNYLLMGNVIDKKASLVEHFTQSPGNYSPITKLGVDSQVQDIEGVEKGKSTTLKFSLPTASFSKYQKDLSEGKEYVMLIAYSQKDDFQHHSIMRTSINIKL